MSEVAGLPVKGYSPTQSKRAIDFVNELKVLEERCLRSFEALLDDKELAVDGRWVAIAKTHIQQGFMAAARGVFKPNRISGPLD